MPNHSFDVRPLGRREVMGLWKACRAARDVLDVEAPRLAADMAGAERRGQLAIAAGLKLARDHVAAVQQAMRELEAAMRAARTADDEPAA